MTKTVQERIAAFPKRIVVDFQSQLARGAVPTRYGIVDPGDRGYQPLYINEEKITLEELDEMCARMNNTRKPTEAEREAALIGSMFGWDVPGADPESYTVKIVLSGKGAVEEAKEKA